MNDNPSPSEATSIAQGGTTGGRSERRSSKPRPTARTTPSSRSSHRGTGGLDELDRTRRLTRQAEWRLAERIAEGDGAALLELLTAHRWLVAHFARRYQGMGLQLGDLVQEGNIGLLRAARGFDRRRGFRFATYAAWWVRQAMGRAVTNQGHAVRLPVHLRHAERRLRRARADLEQRHGHTPEPAELAAQAGVSAEVLVALESTLHTPLSLETPSRPEEDGSSLAERLADEHATNPEREALRNRLRSEVLRALACLTEREQQILRMRFGVGRRGGLSLRQVGEAFDLTRERIRQIERRALGKLRRGEHGRRLRSLASGAAEPARADGGEGSAGP